MNSFVAANILESPLVLLAILLLSSLYSWLMKKRQSNQEESRPAGDERRPSPGAQGRPEHAPNVQEILRRLLGGEPPPQLPPPLPFAVDGGEPPHVGRDEQQFDPQRTWMAGTQEAHEKARQPAHEAAERARQHAALAHSERRDKAARRFAQLNEQGRHPATVVSTARGRRSGTRPASHWRDSRSVRRAFVASLIFAPPKGLEP